MATANPPILTRLRDDEGMGLIVVIGISAVLALLMAVATATAIRSLRSSTTHNNFEGALAAAETGLDRELSRIQGAQNGTPPTPDPCPAVSTPAPSVFNTAETERQWAEDALVLLSQNADCLRRSGQGEYVAFKSPNRRTVYAMGWSPSRTHPNAKMRYLKADYVFAPFRPRQAVLTGGTTNFSGSVLLNSTSGQAASIHSNSSVTGVNNSLIASGAITASGNVTSCSTGVQGGCTSTQPLETVPQANPRAVYVLYNNATDPAPQNWYDLCPDGKIELPSVTGVPCTGVEVASAPFMNWDFVPGTPTAPGLWTLDNVRSGSVYPGTFYVLGANARLGDKGNTATTQNVSVLVESSPTPPAGYSNALTCNKYGGDLEWKLFSLQNHMKGVIFVVSGSLTGTAKATARAGVMLAGDKVDLGTSSGGQSAIVGSVIANNTCAAAGVNSIQGVNITYDQNVEAPVYSTITITTWLELVG